MADAHNVRTARIRAPLVYLTAALTVLGPAANVARAEGLNPVRDLLMHISRGSKRAASEELAHIESTSDVIHVLTDRRFESVWPEFETLTGGDAIAAAERSVDCAAAKRAARPQRLNRVVRHLRELRTAGRARDALADGSRVLEQIMADPNQFLDTKVRMARFLDEMAAVLADVGAMDQAHKLLAAAANIPHFYGASELASPNVSQRLNGAFLLAMDARPAEALALVGDLDRVDVSDYGFAKLLVVRICALAQSADTDGVDRSLRILRHFRRKNTSSFLQTAMLCADREDEGVALMVWRLESPAHRRDALMQLQRYRSPPHTPAFEAKLLERLDRLRDHAEVSTATERHGRIRRWGIVNAGRLW